MTAGLESRCRRFILGYYTQRQGVLKQAQADVSSEAVAIRMGTASGWDLMRRAMFVVNATSVSGTIISAKIRLYVNSKTETLASQSLVLTNGGTSIYCNCGI